MSRAVLTAFRQWTLKLSRSKVTVAWTVALFILILICFVNFIGVFRIYYEKDFSTFRWPLDVDDFPELISSYRQGKSLIIAPAPIADYASIPLLEKAADGCNRPHYIVIVVKSAPGNWAKRTAIRNTWGHPENLIQGHNSDVGEMKLVFIIGSVLEEMESNKSKVIEEKLKLEMEQFKDIVRADFVDSYDNNTIKTMVAFQWAVGVCPLFQYFFLVDDDMFVSIKNLIRFLQNPNAYPNDDGRSTQPVPEKLYAGKVIFTRPIRAVIGPTSSKWFVPVEEYPYNYYPPYTPAAAVILSKSVVEDMVIAAQFSQPFRFDDVFLGILAFKMNVTPLNSDFFYVCHSTDGRCTDTTQVGGHPMDHVIARHGLTSPQELVELWQEEKDRGRT